MGTPEFAVPSLQVLVEAGFNVVAVITAPDKRDPAMLAKLDAVAGRVLGG